MSGEELEYRSPYWRFALCRLAFWWVMASPDPLAWHTRWALAHAGYYAYDRRHELSA